MSTIALFNLPTQQETSASSFSYFPILGLFLQNKYVCVRVLDANNNNGNCTRVCPALRGAEAVRAALLRFLQLFSPPEGFRWRFPVRQISIAGGGGQAGGGFVGS